MQFETAPAPHITTGNTVAKLMRRVLLATLPGIALLGYWFGVGILTNLLLATVFAVALETLALRLRRLPVRHFVADSSALVSAWLGGYTEAAQLLAVLPFVIGLASLAISEPEFEPRSVAPQQ